MSLEAFSCKMRLCKEATSYAGLIYIWENSISFSSVSIKINNYSGGVKGTVSIIKEYNN